MAQTPITANFFPTSDPDQQKMMLELYRRQLLAQQEGEGTTMPAANDMAGNVVVKHSPLEYLSGALNKNMALNNSLSAQKLQTQLMAAQLMGTAPENVTWNQGVNRAGPAPAPGTVVPPANATDQISPGSPGMMGTYGGTVQPQAGDNPVTPQTAMYAGMLERFSPGAGKAYLDNVGLTNEQKNAAASHTADPLDYANHLAKGAEGVKVVPRTVGGISDVPMTNEDALALGRRVTNPGMSLPGGSPMGFGGPPAASPPSVLPSALPEALPPLGNGSMNTNPAGGFGPGTKTVNYPDGAQQTFAAGTPQSVIDHAYETNRQQSALQNPALRAQVEGMPIAGPPGPPPDVAAGPALTPQPNPPITAPQAAASDARSASLIPGGPIEPPAIGIDPRYVAQVANEAEANKQKMLNPISASGDQQKLDAENAAADQKTFEIMNSNLPVLLGRLKTMRANAKNASSGYGVNNEGDGWKQEFAHQFMPGTDTANALTAQASAQSVLPELGPQLSQAGIKGNKFLEQIANNAVGMDPAASPQAKAAIVDGLQNGYVNNFKALADRMRARGQKAPTAEEIDGLVAHHLAGTAAGIPPAPKNVDPGIWQHMTPQERALFK